MTVLEKIKRCVSLVWDFQEFYGEEDIEDFCDNELSTYTQYNEIVEYFKHLAELEKENERLTDELKAENEANENGAKKYAEYYFETNDQLTKAKEIIKNCIHILKHSGTALDWKTVINQAEQFLKEIEK